MLVREKCPICGEPAEPAITLPYDSPELRPSLDRLSAATRTTFGTARFEIRHCRDCDFSFQTVVPTGTEVIDLYSLHPDSEVIDDEIARQKLHWFSHVAEEVLVMRQMVRNNRPWVLDFGCNWGKWASMALAYGCRVDAVEVNPTTAQFCAARGIQIVDADALTPGRYDFINVDQVMEHIANPLDLAQRLTGALAPGGYIKWSTPRDDYLLKELVGSDQESVARILNSRRIDALEPLIHINLFSNRALNALATRVGLRSVSLPLLTGFGAAQLWNIPRQIGRNLTVPWKRWRRNGTYLWFTRGN